MRVMALIAVLLASCGRPDTAEPAAPSPDLAHHYPAVRWVPADASYVITARRLRDLVTSARELAAAVGLFADGDLSDLHVAARGVFGFSPLEEDDLAGIGLAVDGPAALFSLGLYPTMVMQVEKPDQLHAFVAGRRPAEGLEVRRHRGFDLYTWFTEDEAALSWVVVDDWFAVRRYDPRSDREPTGWLDRLLATRQRAGMAGQPDFADAVDTGRVRLPRARSAPDLLMAGDRSSSLPGLVGLVRLEPLSASLPSGLEPMIAACAPAGRDNGRVMLAADVAWGGAEGVVELELDPRAARALDGAISDDLPSGFRELADDSAVHLSLALDLAWLDRLATTASCPLLPRLPRRLRQRVGAGAVSSYAVAASELRPSERTGRVAIFLGLRDPGFATSLLDRIPMRSTIERPAVVAGVDVKVLAVPMMPVVRYRLTDASLTVAVGDGVMERMLAPGGPEVGSGRIILDAGIAPPRMPELGQTLEAASRALGLIGHRYFRRTEQRLSRYQNGWVRLSLEGDELVLRLGMRQ